MNEVLQKSAEDYEPRGRLDPEGYDRHVTFNAYPPPEDLAPFIEHFWSILWDTRDGTYNSEEVMHRPFVDVFFSREQSGIQGTFRGKRTYVAAGRGRILGIRFRPAAFHSFWGGALADLNDKFVDLQALFPLVDGGFVESLLARGDESAMGELVHLLREKHPRPDPNIDLVNEIIAGVEKDESLATVSAVAREFGRSERWLQQLFKDYVGIGLKWLLQRRRLLAAASRIRDSERPDWAGLAYELGYSSQQHFISQFKQVLGKTPLQYKKELTAPSRLLRDGPGSHSTIA